MKVWLLAALLAVGAMVPFVLQRGNINRLQAENARLRDAGSGIDCDFGKECDQRSGHSFAAGKRSFEGATSGIDAAARGSDCVAQVDECGRGCAAASCERPGGRRRPEPAVAGVAAPPVLTTNGPPWNFKGYARPEDTVSTIVWAMEQGRLDLLLNSATPEAQVTLQQEYGPSSNPTEQLQRQARDIVEVRPSQNYPPTENEVYMSMVINRPEQQLIAEQKMDIGGWTVEKGQPYTIGAQNSETIVKLQRVGNDWKFGGKIGK